MSSIVPPVCSDDQIRRALVIARSDLNGIDYIDVDPTNHASLTLYFLKPVPPLDPANPNDTDDAYGLSGDLAKITFTGGTRIVGIQPAAASRKPDGSILVTASKPGDFSTYTIALAVPVLDPLFASIDFSFMASCPVAFDCRPVINCPPQPPAELTLDYEAKDYASFRQLLLDLLPQLNPNFTETNPSDLGIALVELQAYVGDRLSYFQDAVANEAYLDTLRQRISARRHARLIDYRMHDGRNAWACVHIAVNAAFTLPAGTALLSHIGAPLLGDTVAPGVVIDGSRINAVSLLSDPALDGVVVFETVAAAALDPANDAIFIHSWGNEECCLPGGATEAFLFALRADGKTATLPVLQQGDYLLIEEVLGPQTGLAADADTSRRQVVMLDQAPAATSDGVFSNQLDNGALQAWSAGDQPLPLLRVHWQKADQLAQPFCLSHRLEDGTLIRNIAMARGNMVMADHGLTTTEAMPLTGPVPDQPPFRPRLSFSPLTMQIRPAQGTDLSGSASQAQPAVSLHATFPTGTDLWKPLPDLLESTSYDTVFVAEVDNSDSAVLRFGDDEYGRSMTGATALQATYRFGNGLAGNVGAEALAHIAPAIPTLNVTLVRNPLPARDGTDPETIADVQQWAPEAFRAVQYRAVTEADYEVAALLLPQVESSVASFRWTGSWYTAFVGIQPADLADLVNGPEGQIELSPSLQQTVLNFLMGFRLAGYDLEIRAPEFLALEIDLLVCAAPDYFRSDVQQAVLIALGSQLQPGGGKGLFYPGNFVFGQPVYASEVYAAATAVTGVESVVITKFVPFGQPDNGELAQGVIPVGPWQIAELANDPNFMERGVLSVTVRGGKL